MAALGHGACAHEAVHAYDVPGSVGMTADSHSGVAVSPGAGVVIVNDSETGDCDGDGVPGDFDGDLDIGTGGGAFGHGPWAGHCGFHVETAGSVTVVDFLFGATVFFATGSDDALGFLFDPETGENTCVTDGVISPDTDLEEDDCLSARSTGTQPITCPGGGDGLLWVFIAGVEGLVDPNGATIYNPGTLGSITSP